MKSANEFLNKLSAELITHPIIQASSCDQKIIIDQYTYLLNCCDRYQQ